MINYNETVGGGIASLMPRDDMMSPGAFDFAQRSEPVLRMARGGVLRFDGGGYLDQINFVPAPMYGDSVTAPAPAPAPAPAVASTVAAPAVAAPVDLGINDPTFQSNLTNLLSQAAAYQDAKNAAATAAGFVPTQGAAFNTAGNQLANILNQYTTGNVAATNAAIQGSGFNEPQLAKALGLSTADELSLAQRGYNIPGAVKTVEDLVKGAYGTIGRTGVGTGTSQIDQPGLDYWTKEITEGRIDPNKFGGIFRSAVDDYISKNPDNPYSTQAIKSLAPSIFGDESGKVTASSLNKGFEWAQTNNVSEANLVKALGQPTYDRLSNAYGQGIVSLLQPILADGLTTQEALTLGGQFKKLGIDENDLTKYAKMDAKDAKALIGASDTAAKNIITNVLDPKSTATMADKIGSVLTLEQKYGYSDADIARLSDGKVTEKDVTNFFAPAKSFATDFQKVASNPDADAKDVLAFFNKSKADPVISTFYADKLAALQPQMDAVQRLLDVGSIKGDKASYDAYGIAKLASQLGNSFDKSVSSGGAFNTKGEQIGFKADEAAKIFGDKTSGANQVLLDMAAQLQDIGIKDLKQVGVRMVDVPQMVRVGTGGEGEFEMVPTGRMEKKQEFFDKTTGKALDKINDMGGKFGETYTGKGATDYYLKADDKGNVQAYTKARDTSDAGTIAPLLAMATAFAAPWLAGQISALLPGAATMGAAGSGVLSAATGANTLASQALAGGLLKGGIAALADQDFGKAFLSGAINPLVSSGVGSLINAGMGTVLPSDLSVGTQNLLKTAGTSLLSGQKPEDILTNMGFGYGMNQLFGPNAGIVAPLVTSLAKTGTINPNMLFNTATQLGRTANP